MLSQNHQRAQELSIEASLMKDVEPDRAKSLFTEAACLEEKALSEIPIDIKSEHLEL